MEIKILVDVCDRVNFQKLKENKENWSAFWECIWVFAIAAILGRRSNQYLMQFTDDFRQFVLLG